MTRIKMEMLNNLFLIFILILSILNELDAMKLGFRCQHEMDCTDHIKGSSCSMEGFCECAPYYVQFNDTTCLPSQLLGSDCVLPEQCSMKVANSSCLEGACRCVEGFLQFRKHTCLGPARPGAVCYSNAHCEMYSLQSHCDFLIPNLFGRCQCTAPAKQVGGNCVDKDEVVTTETIVLPASSTTMSTTMSMTPLNQALMQTDSVDLKKDPEILQEEDISSTTPMVQELEITTTATQNSEFQDHGEFNEDGDNEGSSEDHDDYPYKIESEEEITDEQTDHVHIFEHQEADDVHKEIDLVENVDIGMSTEKPLEISSADDHETKIPNNLLLTGEHESYSEVDINEKLPLTEDELVKIEENVSDESVDITESPQNQSENKLGENYSSTDAINEDDSVTIEAAEDISPTMSPSTTDSFETEIELTTQLQNELTIDADQNTENLYENFTEHEENTNKEFVSSTDNINNEYNNEPEQSLSEDGESVSEQSMENQNKIENELVTEKSDVDTDFENHGNSNEYKKTTITNLQMENNKESDESEKNEDLVTTENPEKIAQTESPEISLPVNEDNIKSDKKQENVLNFSNDENSTENMNDLQHSEELLSHDFFVSNSKENKTSFEQNNYEKNDVSSTGSEPSREVSEKIENITELPFEQILSNETKQPEKPLQNEVEEMISITSEEQKLTDEYVITENPEDLKIQEGEGHTEQIPNHTDDINIFEVNTEHHIIDVSVNSNELVTEKVIEKEESTISLNPEGIMSLTTESSEKEKDFTEQNEFSVDQSSIAKEEDKLLEKEESTISLDREEIISLTTEASENQHDSQNVFAVDQYYNVKQEDVFEEILATTTASNLSEEQNFSELYPLPSKQSLFKDDVTTNLQGSVSQNNESILKDKIENVFENKKPEAIEAHEGEKNALVDQEILLTTDKNSEAENINETVDSDDNNLLELSGITNTTQSDSKLDVTAQSDKLDVSNYDEDITTISTKINSEMGHLSEENEKFTTAIPALSEDRLEEMNTETPVSQISENLSNENESTEVKIEKEEKYEEIKLPILESYTKIPEIKVSSTEIMDNQSFENQDPTEETIEQISLTPPDIEIDRDEIPIESLSLDKILTDSLNAIEADLTEKFTTVKPNKINNDFINYVSNEELNKYHEIDINERDDTALQQTENLQPTDSPLKAEVNISSEKWDTNDKLVDEEITESNIETTTINMIPAEEMQNKQNYESTFVSPSDSQEIFTENKLPESENNKLIIESAVNKHEYPTFTPEMLDSNHIKKDHSYIVQNSVNSDENEKYVETPEEIVETDKISIPLTTLPAQNENLETHTTTANPISIAEEKFMTTLFPIYQKHKEDPVTTSDDIVFENSHDSNEAESNINLVELTTKNPIILDQTKNAKITQQKIMVKDHESADDINNEKLLESISDENVTTESNHQSNKSTETTDENITSNSLEMVSNNFVINSNSEEMTTVKNYEYLREATNTIQPAVNEEMITEMIGLASRTTIMEPLAPITTTLSSLIDDEIMKTTTSATTANSRTNSSPILTTRKPFLNYNNKSTIELRKRVDLGIGPISLGLSCVSDKQCQLSDPYTYCNGNNLCDCTSRKNIKDSNKCSAEKTGCSAGTFQCRSSGVCISWFFVCDGRPDCTDASDEECQHNTNLNRYCPKQSFKCYNSGQCISRAGRCDGKKQCPHGEDEINCHSLNTGKCPDNTYQCKSGECLPEYEYCNAIISCKDGSDEPPHLCGSRSVPNFFQRLLTSNIASNRDSVSSNNINNYYCPHRCSNGRCRSSAIVCSGRDGCGDGTDEETCSVCRCSAPVSDHSKYFGSTPSSMLMW